MKLTTEELRDIIIEELESVIDEKKGSKRQRKKKAKKDACYRKVKARYDVWPSAYGSGALSKCRKVGAKNWGNKSKKNEALDEAEITDDEREELEDVSKQLKGAVKAHGKQAKTIDKALKNESLLKDPKVSKHLKYHIREGVGVDKNVFRPDSDSFYSLFREVRKLHSEGRYTLNENEKHYILETDIGKFGMFEGERVALDHPMLNEDDIEEAKQKKKKDPPIGKPTKNTGGGKKYKVYVRNPKTGNVKKITYGDAKGGLKGNWNSAEARKSFAARHKCADKKDRMSSGYWACRAHKDFGKNVPGRFW